MSVLAGSGRYDLIGLTLASLFHGGLILYMYVFPPPKPSTKSIVVVDIRKKEVKPPELPPPPPEPPPPPPPPEPPKKLVKKEVRPAEAPKTNTPPPPEPPPQVPQPVFGVDPSQTGGQGISVPLGNTTMADPSRRPKVQEVPALPPASAPGGSEYHPVSEEELSKLPAQNNDECGLSMKAKWAESEAHALGLEGQVVLRIELDARGKARSVRVVKGLHPDADKIARGFLLFDPRCRFEPALGKDGKAAPFVIERYTVRFENE